MNKARSGKKEAKYAEELTRHPRPAVLREGPCCSPCPTARPTPGITQEKGPAQAGRKIIYHATDTKISPRGDHVLWLSNICSFAVKIRPMAFCYVGWSQNPVTIGKSPARAHPPNRGKGHCGQSVPAEVWLSAHSHGNPQVDVRPAAAVNADRIAQWLCR